ncbi:hypothetical protein GCM10023094_11010 [Rhodococcus olei]|uniref:Glycine rich protein n=1 Tax=Rhodococcus olei TaxID=2161675 RepID=A0ABP8NYK5_9NOCA
MRVRRVAGLAAAVGLVCTSAGMMGAGAASAQAARSIGCSSTVGNTSCTYDSVGIDEYFLDVPADVNTMHVTATGGAGGGAQGGRGAVVDADVRVTPGTRLYVVVGSGGGTGTNRGGGYSGVSTASLDDGLAALTGRLLVAGGGGGAGLGAGGDAGAPSPGGGLAGTEAAGGAAGLGGGAGQLGVGGAGGVGGGGGGGLYGGGGGTAGGGGGSSLVPTGGTLTLASAGTAAKVVVSFSTSQLALTGSDDGGTGSGGSSGSAGSGSAGSSGSGSAGSSDPFGSSAS